MDGGFGDHEDPVMFLTIPLLIVLLGIMSRGQYTVQQEQQEVH